MGLQQSTPNDQKLFVFLGIAFIVFALFGHLFGVFSIIGEPFKSTPVEGTTYFNPVFVGQRVFRTQVIGEQQLDREYKLREVACTVPILNTQNGIQDYGLVGEAYVTEGELAGKWVPVTYCNPNMYDDLNPITTCNHWNSGWSYPQSCTHGMYSECDSLCPDSCGSMPEEVWYGYQNPTPAYIITDKVRCRWHVRTSVNAGGRLDYSGRQAIYVRLYGDAYVPSCDDGIKNQDEVEIDCGGVCPSCVPTEDCGNGVCDSSENYVSCPLDCPAPDLCGNGECDNEENAVTCPSDCFEQPPPPFNLSLMSWIIILGGSVVVIFLFFKIIRKRR